MKYPGNISGTESRQADALHVRVNVLDKDSPDPFPGHSHNCDDATNLNFSKPLKQAANKTIAADQTAPDSTERRRFFSLP
jgi:hypothetical protein